DRDERALRAQRRAEHLRDALHDAEEGRQELGGHILQRREVLARDDQGVSRHEGRAIEERDDKLVAIDLVMRGARDDLAEDVGGGVLSGGVPSPRSGTAVLSAIHQRAAPNARPFPVRTGGTTSAATP